MNYNVFFVLSSDMIQITLLFCAQLRNAMNYNVVFCPELRNAINYNAFFVLNSEML